MLDKREIEIRRNFSFFQGHLATLMAEHAGQIALLRDQTFIGFYDSAAEAVADGARKFGDLPFSVQRVIATPVDLGFLSHAADNGITV